ncbi:MAG: hypothetical protein J3K34DRAFT_409292 [Monoraphidium minutum]|nr:MAG: hypothetical protein J3K34DRAFT_409292 [Monoraphidium minutum]
MRPPAAPPGCDGRGRAAGGASPAATPHCSGVPAWFWGPARAQRPPHTFVQLLPFPSRLAPRAWAAQRAFLVDSFPVPHPSPPPHTAPPRPSAPSPHPLPLARCLMRVVQRGRRGQPRAATRVRRARPPPGRHRARPGLAPACALCCSLAGAAAGRRTTGLRLRLAHGPVPQGPPHLRWEPLGAATAPRRPAVSRHARMRARRREPPARNASQARPPAGPSPPGAAL